MVKRKIVQCGICDNQEDYKEKHTKTGKWQKVPVQMIQCGECEDDVCDACADRCYNDLCTKRMCDDCCGNVDVLGYIWCTPCFETRDKKEKERKPAWDEDVFANEQIKCAFEGFAAYVDLLCHKHPDELEEGAGDIISTGVRKVAVTLKQFMEPEESLVYTEAEFEEKKKQYEEQFKGLKKEPKETVKEPKS